MFSDPTVLSPDVPTAVATNTVSYSKLGDVAESSLYRNPSFTIGLSDNVVISHQTTKDQTKRHLLRLDKSFSTVGLDTVKTSVYLNIVIPANSESTVADIKAQVNKLLNFLATGSNANVTKLVNGEL